MFKQAIQFQNWVAQSTAISLNTYLSTVFALFESRGSIFQNGFLGGVQFKFGSNLSNFWPKTRFLTGVVLQNSNGLGSIQEWSSNNADVASHL